MPHYAAFHLGLHCLLKDSYRSFPVYKGLSKQEGIKGAGMANGKHLMFLIMLNSDISILSTTAGFLEAS